MSEQPSSSPPPPPKPGSLRDRIAAFEKPGASAPSISASKPPPIRPKPGHVQWKPAPPSPKETVEDTDKKPLGGGMSPSDAKESIKSGLGSLKERMAALQGKGAFGNASPSPPPPPGPKPARRTPLVVSPPPEDREDTDAPQANTQEQSQSETVDKESAQPSEMTEETIITEATEEEQDEATKEQERRAAIAARMARLGGARVGMSPPMFAPKPPIKPKPKPASSTSPPPSETQSPAVNEEDTEPTLNPPEDVDTSLSTESAPVATPIEVKETGSDTLQDVTGRS